MEEQYRIAEYSKTLSEYIQTKRNLIYESEKKIQKYYEEIKKLKKELYMSCKHEWIYDECTNFDDRSNYICKFCKLNKNPHYN
jgi:hypothetical protein